MLKTNSKKALENIRAYIFDYSADRFEEDNGRAPADMNEALTYVYDYFIDTYFRNHYQRTRMPESELFREWAQGLPLNDLFCYYYNREALDDLAAILEETEAEKARYTESDAERLLTSLIYREVRKAADKKARQQEPVKEHSAGILDRVAAAVEEIGRGIEEVTTGQSTEEHETITA